MAPLLLALALLQAPSSQVRFDCEVPLRPGTVQREPWRLTITLGIDGTHIASVLLDGPPTFSSYRPIRVRRDGTPTTNGPPELLPRNMQWRGSFQGRAIHLRREGTDMVIEPERGAAGVYAGFWTYAVTVDNRRLEANGTIRCRIIAGTLSESAPS